MLIRSGDTDKPNSPMKPLNLVAGLLILAGVFALVMSGQMQKEKPADESVLFELNGQQYTVDELPHRYRQQFYDVADQAYKRQQQILATAATAIYVDKQMNETGEDKATVIKRLFNIEPPTEAQVRAFYQQNRQRINGTYEQAKNQIALLLLAQIQQQKQMELLSNLQELKEFKFHLAAPQAPTMQLKTDGYPTKGPESAKVTLVEFGDYQCGHCRNSFFDLKKVLPEYEDKVRFVFMDFPVNTSGISRKVAEGAVCADQQGQFWTYHEMAFEQQSSLNESSPQAFANSLNLDISSFEQCLSDKATSDKVNAAAKQAIDSGVTGTPSFFLNGIKLSDADRRQGWKHILDEALAASEQDQ